MGCFLACFGFTKKRKRRKTSTKIISYDQSYGRYVPLDSDVSVKINVVEIPNQKVSPTKLSDKPKKKVSFNLNVKTYEPLPSDDFDSYLSEEEEKTMWEYNQEEKSEKNKLQFEEDSIASMFGSYPANYRYQNCRNSYDDDDDDDDIDDYLDSDEEDDNVDEIEVSKNEKMKRNRNGKVCSVLNPVENLTQWKEIKAKSRQQSKQQRYQKENIAVDASLSNWLSNR